MSDAGANTQTPLSTRLTQVLGSSFTDYGVREALESLDGQLLENNPTSLRRLRAQFESSSIRHAGELLDNYAQVVSVSIH